MMYIHLKDCTGIQKELNYCSFLCGALVILYGITLFVLRLCCCVINVFFTFWDSFV